MTTREGRLRSHDYPFLMQCWRRLARRGGLRMSKFAESGGQEIYCLESPRREGGGLYLSAGIHGDESASVVALLEWAESEIPFLQNFPVLIFPCLNPWGLIHNCRLDCGGRDLNRQFHTARLPQIAAHKRLLAGRQFEVAATLHEDYDARGVYLYEIARARPFLGEQLLGAASQCLPRESRASIEGRRCRDGLIRRRITPETMKQHPEAFVLHFHHSLRTITLETPSEFSIHERVEAHLSALRAIQSFLVFQNKSGHPASR